MGKKEWCPNWLVSKGSLGRPTSSQAWVYWILFHLSYKVCCKLASPQIHVHAIQNNRYETNRDRVPYPTLRPSMPPNQSNICSGFILFFFNWLPIASTSRVIMEILLIKAFEWLWAKSQNYWNRMKLITNLKNRNFTFWEKKAENTATQVEFRWAGAILEVPWPFGQERDIKE